MPKVSQLANDRSREIFELTDSFVDLTKAHRRCKFNPWVGKIPWRRKLQLTPVFLSGKPHGQRRLAGYSPGGHQRVGHNLITRQQEL